MPMADANGLRLAYETHGSPDHPAMLLVMGYTAQLTSWPDQFCQRLADHGFHVIRFDNRDSGLSTKLDGVAVDMAAAVAARLGQGSLADVPYTLSDMSDDGIGLLDALGIDRAHIVGASMGGAIAQTMAIEHPERVASLTAIMSTTGEPEFTHVDADTANLMLAPAPTERHEVIEAAVATWRMLGSPRFFDEEDARRRAALSYDRSFYPEGASRQMAAIAASGSRADGLRSVRVPTLVIHGRADPVHGIREGERIAELVEGANLLVCNDMGHDLPRPLWPLMCDAIAANARSVA